MIRSRLLRPLLRSGSSALLACIALSAIGALSVYAGSETELLAPKGHLRVGVYPGSPTSMVTDPATKQTHGVAYDLGAEFAKRLQVPVEYVTFQRVADVVSAIKNGEVDFTVTNATPARANDVSFSPPVISVELGDPVPANSPISRADDLDRPGVRIGVTKGSTSERTLPAHLKTQPSSRPKASSWRSGCSAAANSILMPPTSRRCSKCRIRCRTHGSSTAIGDWSTWPWPFPKDGSKAWPLSEHL